MAIYLDGSMTGPTPQRPKVLLVDDCAAERDLYELVLASDFDVVTAARGHDALAMAASMRPDVVVLDVMMPGLDGWDTCTRLKAEPKTADTPVVMLTGSDDPDLAGHAKAVGAEGLETKPCPADRLVAHIHDVIEKRRKAVWGN
jgi:CheY-like chemotaxis protein